MKNLIRYQTAAEYSAEQGDSGVVNSITPGVAYIKETYRAGNWVSGVATTGTFVKNSAATWTTTGVNGVPSGWTIQTASS